MKFFKKIILTWNHSFMFPSVLDTVGWVPVRKPMLLSLKVLFWNKWKTYSCSLDLKRFLSLRKNHDFNNYCLNNDFYLRFLTIFIEISKVRNNCTGGKTEGTS